MTRSCLLRVLLDSRLRYRFHCTGTDADQLQEIVWYLRDVVIVITELADFKTARDQALARRRAVLSNRSQVSRTSAGVVRALPIAKRIAARS